MATPMIELRQIYKIYRMGQVEVNAMQDVSLVIERGEMAAIMGPSGSGKSTMMNVLGCLDAPTSGQYLFEGEDVGRLSDDRLAAMRNRKIGFIFQTYNLLPRLTALGNVELPMLYGNGRNRRQRALAALERVGLANRIHHLPTQLSGGQQQRVGIARALAKNPSLILADEPTGNLDTRSSMEILAILQDLNEREGITIAIVTHEPDIAAHTRRVITMRDGQVVSDEKVREPLRAARAGAAA